MKKSMYIALLLVLLTIVWTTGCTTRQQTAETDTLTDSAMIDTLGSDTLETLIEETPMPKAADELFDDFIFNFAANKKLQLSRIDFPLATDNFGKTATMQQRQWRMERFFMRQGFYTLIAGSQKDLDGSKDTKTEHVIIEKIFLDKNFIQQYVFNRVDGLWKMQQVNKQTLRQNVNGDFYSFYSKFSTDSLFRQQSLAESVDFSGPDPEDDFSRMEGSIMPEQWEMFGPELPKGMIYNIIYGEDRKISGNQRLFVVRGIANGMETQLTFKKSKDGYQLTKINM